VVLQKKICNECCAPRNIALWPGSQYKALLDRGGQHGTCGVDYCQGQRRDIQRDRFGETPAATPSTHRRTSLKSYRPAELGRTITSELQPVTSMQSHLAHQPVTVTYLPMMHALTIDSIVKRYDAHLRRQFIGRIPVASSTGSGPNAQQDPTIRMVMTSSRAIGSIPCSQDPRYGGQWLRSIGLLPEERGLYKKMKVLT